MSSKKQVSVSGAFDDIQSQDLRVLEEAAKLGEVSALLWPDDSLEKNTGQPPKFPLVERFYFLSAVRYVSRVIVADPRVQPDALPDSLGTDVWADYGAKAIPAREKFCRDNKIVYRHFERDELKGLSKPAPLSFTPGRKKVLATGSFDWLHSGHVRFFEEVSTYGDLCVIVGHDTNIRLLKGKGHPLIPQEERRYAVGSIKFVKEALISTGSGWLDADPEIRKLKPDIYAVNEDGDRGGKREYCRKLGIEYLVLKREPAPGLPERSSTILRGF